MSEKTPTLADTLGEFDAGLFEQKAMEALKKVVLGSLSTGKKGQISIVLDLERLSEEGNFLVKHTLKFTQPTRNGKTAEENATTTPMYANSTGLLSIFPHNQDDMYRPINSTARIINS